jgi:hypothetical protein
MADPFGLSFSPADQSGPNGQPTNGQRPSPVQQAIQTLSLRIPRVVGASGLAPTPLLNSQGGSALGGDPNSAALLEQLKRLLFGSPASSPMSSPFPQAPQGDLGQTLSGMFGSPGGPVSQPPDSGSGEPLPGSGTGSPLPTGIPNPKVLPGGDGVGGPDTSPMTQPLGPMAPPIMSDRGNRGGRGV